MTLNRTFKHGGGGVYKCDSCGKMTRDTGRGEQEGVCAACYDEAGWENEHNDNGGFHVTDSVGLNGYPSRTKNPAECPLCRAEVEAMSDGPSGEVHPGVELAREPEPTEPQRYGGDVNRVCQTCGASYDTLEGLMQHLDKGCTD